jgi:flagellar biogenesis protein FliO
MIDLLTELSTADWLTPLQLYPAIGDAGASSGASLQSDGGSSFPILRVFGAVLVVVLLILLLMPVLRSGVFRKLIRKPNHQLQIEETAMLGNRQFLVVVRYGEQRRLVGVGPGLINDLCELPGPKDDPAELPLEAEAQRDGEFRKSSLGGSYGFVFVPAWVERLAGVVTRRKGRTHAPE